MLRRGRTRAPGARSRWLRALACAAGLAAAAADAADGAKLLNVYNWSDYIGDNTIHQFEKETGIKVNYDTFDSNEALYAKLRAGHTGYDVVVPSSYWAKREIEAGLLLKLDHARVSTYANLDPFLMDKIAVSANDSGNSYVLPWLWGVTTLGINVDRVREALGPLPMPQDTWDLLFKPEYVSRFTHCGVSVLDTGDEILPAALRYLGRNGYSHNLADYQEASKLLATIRPYVTLFSSSGYINGLADGSLCLVLGWSGDIAIAGQRAKEAKNGQKIAALVPKGGALMFFDTMAIPVDAPHVENAYKWMSFIYRPEVQAEIVTRSLHNSAVRASDKLVAPELHTLSGLFLSPEELARLAPQEALPDAILRVRTRLFRRFRTDQQ
jgi:putrescine transport system substrate-binding protein